MSETNIKSQDLNSSESMGQIGNYPVIATTKEFNQGEHISTITVLTGTATVTGNQHVNNPNQKDWYPAWSALELPVGTYIVNLKNVTIVATGNTIAYYGA